MTISVMSTKYVNPVHAQSHVDHDQYLNVSTHVKYFALSSSDLFATFIIAVLFW